MSAIDLYLGGFSGGWAVDGRRVAWDTHEDALPALERWAAEIEAAHATRWRRAAVRLWLSGGLARPFLFGPIVGLRNAREAEALAAAIAPEATGLAGPCRVVLEAWPEIETVLATALPQTLADAVDAITRGHRVRWRSVRPRWASALDDALRDRADLRLFGLLEEDGLTLVGGPTPADTTAAHPAFDRAMTQAPAPVGMQVEALWQRLSLSEDLSKDAVRFDLLDSNGSGSGNLAIEADRGADALSVETDVCSIWPAARERAMESLR